MGEFIHTAIVRNCTAPTAAAALKKAAATEDYSLIPENCDCIQRGADLQIFFNESCAGYDSLTRELSEELQRPVLMLYVYDGDYWGYFFFENGRELDTFMPMPDYFEEVSEEVRANAAGNSALIAQYFHVDEAKIKNYLAVWTEELLEEESRAYPDDEFVRGDSWQMADFMQKLGFPYDGDPDNPEY